MQLHSTHAGNELSDLSGGGLLLGAPRPRLVATAAATCNRVRRAGLEYVGSVGIWGGYLRNSTIRANTLEQLPYSGVSVGWGWTRYLPCDRADAGAGAGAGGGGDGGAAGAATGGECSLAGGNRIERNAVRDDMRVLTCDGAALYVLGPQPNSTLSHNCVARAPPHHPLHGGSRGGSSSSRGMMSSRRCERRPAACARALLRRKDSEAQRKQLTWMPPFALYVDDGAAGFAAVGNTVADGLVVVLKAETTNGAWRNGAPVWPRLACVNATPNARYATEWRRFEPSAAGDAAAAATATASAAAAATGQHVLQCKSFGGSSPHTAPRTAAREHCLWQQQWQQQQQQQRQANTSACMLLKGRYARYGGCCALLSSRVTMERRCRLQVRPPPTAANVMAADTQPNAAGALRPASVSAAPRAAHRCKATAACTARVDGVGVGLASCPRRPLVARDATDAAALARLAEDIWASRQLGTTLVKRMEMRNTSTATRRGRTKLGCFVVWE